MLISVAKLITGGVTAVPIIEEVTGINSMAPPPPDTVEMIKATMPATNKPAKCHQRIDPKQKEKKEQ